MAIIFHEHYITENLAYKDGVWIKPKGVFLHSLGCPGMTALEAIKSMNTVESIKVAMQAIIDVNKEVYITLPIDSDTGECIRNLHGGLDSNYSHIGITMTEPNSIRYIGGSKWVDLNSTITLKHIYDVYNTAVEYVAWLCKQLNWNPGDEGVIMTHKTGYLAGIATAHGDPEHIWDELGLTLEQFKEDVKYLV